MFSSAKNWFVVLRLVIGYVFLNSGWEKITNPEFAAGLGATLGKFAAQNPFGWYKSILLSYSVPNAQTLAPLVAWGEVAAGVMLILGFLTPVGALLAFLLNANFYLAAGWTSPSAHSVNLVMMFVDAALIFVRPGAVLGFDGFLAKKFRQLRWLRAS